MDTELVGLVGIGASCLTLLVGMWAYDQFEKRRFQRLREEESLDTYKGFPYPSESLKALIGKELIAYQANCVDGHEPHLDTILEVKGYLIRTRMYGWIPSIDFVIEDVLPEMASS